MICLEINKIFFHKTGEFYFFSVNSIKNSQNIFCKFERNDIILLSLKWRFVKKNEKSDNVH